MVKFRDFIEHPDEIIPTFRMYFEHRRATKLPAEKKLAFCYDILNSVSRSFAVVTQQLPNSLKDAVCVFYLVLRGLDTVEDDMGIPDEEKLPLLRTFHEKIYDRSFTLDYGEKHYRRLLNEFHNVVDVFLGLEEAHRDAIADITKRMGEGMAVYIGKEVVTLDDFDEYCHYVAGLVGEGLSRLYVGAGLEDKEYLAMNALANDMGLFLQKTNIIRDYLEDIMEEPAPRMFWPRDVWSLYAKQLEDFKEPENREDAVKCLNHLITNALEHVPGCFGYLRKLKDPEVFRFCAIPQVMAIGTLAMCYNNGKVFEGVVKMRRGETCLVFERTHTLKDVCRYFKQYAGTIGAKVQGVVAKKDPNAKKTLAIIETIESLCDEELKSDPRFMAHELNQPIEWWVRALIIILTVGYFMYAFGLGGMRKSLGVQPDAGNAGIDLVQQIMAVALVAIGGGWVGLLGQRI